MEAPRHGDAPDAARAGGGSRTDGAAPGVPDGGEPRAVPPTHPAGPPVDESLLRVLTDWSPLGIFHTDARGLVDYANRRWEEIAGVDHRDFAAIRRAVHPDDVERLTAQWRAALAAGHELVAEFRYVHADGQVRDVATRAMPVKAPGGAVTGFVGTLEDITERKRAAEADRVAFERLLEIEHLKEMDRFKTRILNTASHELNTPLTPLKLQVHLLQSGAFGELAPRQERALSILDRNLERLSGLVGDVLDVARLQSGQLKVQPRAVDVAALVREAADSFLDQAEGAGLRLEVDADAELPAMADARRLSQVVYNLLSNAIKFTPRGGHVLVRAASRDGGVSVEVADTGRGLEPSEIAKLFQPFSQVHDAAEVTQRGTGLGLYISRGIVEQHGGTLDVTSAGHGRGSLFRLWIPAGVPADAPPAAPQGSEAADGPPPGAGAIPGPPGGGPAGAAEAQGGAGAGVTA